MFSKIEFADLRSEPGMDLAEGVECVGVGVYVIEDLVFDFVGE